MLGLDIDLANFDNSLLEKRLKSCSLDFAMLFKRVA